jgi:hypothetical protein
LFLDSVAWPVICHLSYIVQRCSYQRVLSIFVVARCARCVAPAKGIDEYISLRVRLLEAKPAGAEEEKAVVIDPRLERLVERMFDRCFTDHEFKQALGIALETRRLDYFKRAILSSRTSRIPTPAFQLSVVFSPLSNRGFDFFFFPLLQRSSP